MAVMVIQRRPRVVPALLHETSMKKTAIPRTAPAPVSIALREDTALGIDLEPDHLPANAARLAGIR